MYRKFGLNSVKRCIYFFTHFWPHYGATCTTEKWIYIKLNQVNFCLNFWFTPWTKLFFVYKNFLTNSTVEMGDIFNYFWLSQFLRQRDSCGELLIKAWQKHFHDKNNFFQENIRIGFTHQWTKSEGVYFLDIFCCSLRCVCEREREREREWILYL